MPRSLFIALFFFLVLSSTTAVKELEDAKTWKDCMERCVDTPSIFKAVPSCTLACKNIFSSQFETARP